MKTRFLWYWLKTTVDRWGVKQKPARWQWQCYKTSAGWFLMMRFGFFGVNIYRERSYFVSGSTFELTSVNIEEMKQQAISNAKARAAEVLGGSPDDYIVREVKHE